MTEKEKEVVRQRLQKQIEESDVQMQEKNDQITNIEN